MEIVCNTMLHISSVWQKIGFNPTDINQFKTILEKNQILKLLTLILAESFSAGPDPGDNR